MGRFIYVWMKDMAASIIIFKKFFKLKDSSILLMIFKLKNDGIMTRRQGGQGCLNDNAMSKSRPNVTCLI